MNGTRYERTILLAALSVAGFLLTGSELSAQDTGIQALTHRAPSAQAKTHPAKSTDGADTQSVASRGLRVADLFGESDEEKAARLQHEQSQDVSINYVRQHQQDMENTVRRLTGQVEQLDHRIAELNARIERMQKDMDYRLCKIASQQLSAAGGDESGLPCAAGETPVGSAPPSPPSLVSATPNRPPRTVGEPVHLAPPPGVLGTLPAGRMPSQVAAVPPPSANRGRFDAAMKLLAGTQYDEARGAFRAFADAYPNDELAPQAVYWVGDIAYVQKDYPAAAR